MSVPVVVTVHGNQQCDAEATVFWDNAFAEKVSQTPPEACRACKAHRTLEQIEKGHSKYFLRMVDRVKSACRHLAFGRT